MILDKVASEELMLLALHKCAPNSSSSRTYVREYTKLELDANSFVRQTCSQLMSGEFRFQVPRIIDYKGKRPILITAARDRVVEKAIHMVIEPALRSHLCFESTYARKNIVGEAPRSLKALSSHFVVARERLPWIYETDIKTFFPSIDHGLLLEQLHVILVDESLDSILIQIVQRRAEAENVIAAKYSDHFLDIDRGVPQGSILSPLLASAYMIPIDSKFSESGIKYIRYVDDLVVFAESESSALELSEFVLRELKSAKLEAHLLDKPNSKAKICRPGQAVCFVGFDFGADGSVMPSQKAIDSLKAKVESICNDSSNLAELLIKLKMFLEGWMAAYSHCDIHASMRRRLDENILREVRFALRKRGVLSRYSAQFAKRDHARALGIPLFQDLQRKPLSDGLFDDDVLISEEWDEESD